MARLFKTLLSLLVVAIACASMQTQYVEQSEDYHGVEQSEEYQGVEQSEEYHGEMQMLELTPQGKRVYEEYTLGEQEDGAEIIYIYQHTESFEEFQDEITLTFDYPSENMEYSYTITQVTAYLEAGDGATTQAYVTANGIGEPSISMQMVANNSNSLHYMIVLYGKQI